MKIFILVFVVVVLLVGGILLVKSKKQESYTESQNQNYSQDNSYQGYGLRAPFYSNDGISLQHYWPGDENFSNEETEILLFNESSSNLEVKSFDLSYLVEGKTYPHKSATWEKFANKQSWDRIEYLNISQNYYKGESLLLAPGQKGKLHWHIQFGERPLSGKQIVTINLILQKDGRSIPITKTQERSSGTVVSSSDH